MATLPDQPGMKRRQGGRAVTLKFTPVENRLDKIRHRAFMELQPSMAHTASVCRDSEPFLRSRPKGRATSHFT